MRVEAASRSTVGAGRKKEKRPESFANRASYRQFRSGHHEADGRFIWQLVGVLDT